MRGWNVVPLPENKKKSPPSKDDDPQGRGFTGRDARLVEPSDIEAWLEDPRWRKGNIAVRPGNTVEVDGEDMELVGIDVDNYDKKTGGLQLRELESKYGPLPNTFTSSARADGVSGIRWFLCPAGYEYMGKPVMPSTQKGSDSIEIVQRVHRYGLVYPSVHPETGNLYRWYDRGVPPDGVNFTKSVPTVNQITPLPRRWFLFLTRNGIESAGVAPIDMSSSNLDLKAWQKACWVDGEDMCDHMSKHMVNHLDDIENAGDHHEPLVRAHWSLLKLGSEGHTGWASALHVINSAWVDRTGVDGVRTPAEQRYEIARSRFGTLRKIKGEYDEFKAAGVLSLETEDPCEAKRNWEPPKRIQRRKRATEYERNEDGNARHFLDLAKGRVRYVPNHADGVGRWLVFNDKTGRWIVDDKETLVRHLFRRVKERQMRDSRVRVGRAARAVAVAGGATAATPEQNAELKEARAWVTFALESGNKTRVTNSLAQAQSYPGVSLLYEELDRDLFVLPCSNGIIKFATKEQQLAGAKPFEFLQDPKLIKDLMITQNTDVPYIPFKDQKTHDDLEVQANFTKFEQYMRTFLRQHMSAEAFKYTIRLLGLSILGVNIKKAVFLVGKRDTGKSTFQSMMAKSLGQLAIWRDPDIFADTPFKGSLAEALSRRVVMVGELGEKHMDASLFKRITGGDEVACQLKNVNKPVTLKARCTIISGCNSAPEVPNVDDATKERFVVIPFRHQVTVTEKDPNAIEDLMHACRVPLLALLVEQCGKAIVEGVSTVPAELQLATKDFVASLSDLGDFIAENLTLAPPEEHEKYARKDMDDPRDPKPRWPNELCLGRRQLYKIYQEYAKLNNMELLSSTKFTRRMHDAGLVDDGSKNAEGDLRWLGVTQKSNGRVHKA